MRKLDEEVQANLERLLYKLNECINWDTVFAMEKDFNKIGLTLQPTTKDRVVLCRLVEGQPSAQEIGEDYMFLASQAERGISLTERHVRIISDFCINCASKPSLVEGPPRRKWMQGLATYGKIVVVNEDVQHIASLIEE